MKRSASLRRARAGGAPYRSASERYGARREHLRRVAPLEDSRGEVSEQAVPRPRACVDDRLAKRSITLRPRRPWDRRLP